MLHERTCTNAQRDRVRHLDLKGSVINSLSVLDGISNLDLGIPIELNMSILSLARQYGIVPADTSQVAARLDVHELMQLNCRPSTN